MSICRETFLSYSIWNNQKCFLHNRLTYDSHLFMLWRCVYQFMKSYKNLHYVLINNRNRNNESQLKVQVQSWFNIYLIVVINKELNCGYYYVLLRTVIIRFTKPASGGRSNYPFRNFVLCKVPCCEQRQWILRMKARK